MEIGNIPSNQHKVSILLPTRKTSNILMWLREYESTGSYHYNRDWDSGHNADNTMALRCFFSNEEDAMVFALKFK